MTITAAKEIEKTLTMIARSQRLLESLQDNEIDSDYFAVIATSENGTDAIEEYCITDFALNIAALMRRIKETIEAQAVRIAELKEEAGHYKECYWASQKELAALREQEPIGYIDPDSLREYRGVKSGGSWSDKPKRDEYNQTTPIFAQPVPTAPVAVPEEVANITEANNYTAGNAYELDAWMRGANWMRAEVLRLNSGSKPQRFVVALPGRVEADCDYQHYLLAEEDVIAAIRAAGGEIAE